MPIEENEIIKDGEYSVKELVKMMRRDLQRFESEYKDDMKQLMTAKMYDFQSLELRVKAIDDRVSVIERDKTMKTGVENKNNKNKDFVLWFLNSLMAAATTISIYFAFIK